MHILICATTTDYLSVHQHQVVTCSGGGHTGTVNIVRNGADFTELASIPGLTNVTNIWAVRDQFEDRCPISYAFILFIYICFLFSIDSRILVSTLQSTHLLEINDAGSNTPLSYVQEASMTGLIFHSRTVSFRNVARRIADGNGKSQYVNSSLVVQVTPNGAFLLEYDVAMRTYVQHARWEQRGTEVVAASINPSQVVLALNVGKLVVLNITQDNAFNVVV